MYNVYVVHRTPTRLRIKLKDGRIPEELTSTIEAYLSGVPGVESVRVNSVTGSILLQGANVQLENVMNMLASNFPVKIESPKPLHPVQRAIQPFVNLDHTLRRVTGGKVGLAEAGFLTLLGIGAIQILRGNITAPPWYTAFWYAFGVFSRELIARYGCKEFQKILPEISEPGKNKETSQEKKKKTIKRKNQIYNRKLVIPITNN